MRYLAALLLTTILGVSEMHARDIAGLQQDLPLTVLYRSDHPIAPRVIAAMQEEVIFAFFGTGIELNFEPVNPAPSIYARTAMIHFRGDCRAEAPLAVNRPSRDGVGDQLGITHMVDGKILPFADIGCDAIRQVLGSLGTASDQDQLLGKAVGRVVAHELYHVLTGFTGHGRSGLAAAAFSRADLMAPQRVFAPRDLERMRIANAPEVPDTRAVCAAQPARPTHPAAFSFTREAKTGSCP